MTWVESDISWYITEWKPYWFTNISNIAIPRVQVFPSKTPLVTHVLQSNIEHINISHYDGHWYRSRIIWDDVILIMIDQLVMMQTNLLLVSIFVIFLGTVVVYILSSFFVKKALEHTNILAQKVQKKWVIDLTDRTSFQNLPDDDEIQIIAQAIDDMTYKLDTELGIMRNFLGHASHELSTPLTALLSDLELAKETKDYKEWVTTSLISANRMYEIIHALNTFLWIQKDIVQEWWVSSKQEKVEIEHITHEIGEQLQKKDDKKIDIIVNIDKGSSIIWIPGEVYMVLQNLITNAWKYTPPWGTIRIDGDATTYSIYNTWSYISLEDQACIRNPFWQKSKNESDLKKWHWLWLALVKIIVEKNNRDISVLSDSVWTTFIIKR